MHREIRFAIYHRDFQFFREQPFSHDLVRIGEIDRLKTIAGGLDDLQLEVAIRKNFTALGEHQIRLRESEGTAASGDINRAAHVVMPAPVSAQNPNLARRLRATLAPSRG